MKVIKTSLIFTFLLCVYITGSASILEQKYTPIETPGTLAKEVIDLKYKCSDQNIRVIFDQTLMIFFETPGADDLESWKSVPSAARYKEENNKIIASGFRHGDETFNITIDHKTKAITFVYNYDTGYSSVEIDTWEFIKCKKVK